MKPKFSVGDTVRFGSRALETVRDYVCSHPGQTAAEIARGLGLNWSEGILGNYLKALSPKWIYAVRRHGKPRIWFEQKEGWKK